MSTVLDITKITSKHASRILGAVNVSIIEEMGGGLRSRKCYREWNKNIYVPMGLDKSLIPEEAIIPRIGKSRHVYNYNKKLLSGKKQLEEGVDPDKVRDQVEIIEEINQLVPNGIGSVALCASTGIGKTVMITYQVAQWGKRCIVFCDKTDVLDQWEQEFSSCGVTTRRVDNPTKNGIGEAVVYLCTVQTGRKLTPSMTNDIGVVVYDEAHVSTESAVSEVLLSISPDALIIATATIDRRDKLEEALRLYHGDRVITRILKKTLTLHRCDTYIQPDITHISIAGKNRINYPHAMNSVHNDPRYAKCVVDLTRRVSNKPNSKIIVFFRVNEPLELISSMLQLDHFVLNKKIKATSYSGQKIVLAIDKKAKEGINIPGLTDLIMSFSTPDLRQYEGRIRDDDFDIWLLIHDHRMYEKHWKECVDWCAIRSRDTMEVVRTDLYEEEVDSVSELLSDIQEL